MSNFRKTVLSTLLASIVVLGGVAQAETTAPISSAAQPQQNLKYMERRQQHINEFNQAKVNANDAIKAALTKVNGDVIGVRFGTNNGHGYYRVEMIKDNKPEQVNIDAKTGDVITYKVADDRPVMVPQHYGKGAYQNERKGVKQHKGKPNKTDQGKFKGGCHPYFEAGKEFKKPDVSVSLQQAIDTAVEKSGGKVVTARLGGFYKAQNGKETTPSYHILTVKEGKPFRTVIDAKTGEVKEAKEVTKPQKPEGQKPTEAPASN